MKVNVKGLTPVMWLVMYLGGVRKTAKIFKVSDSAVSHWVGRNGGTIPNVRLKQARLIVPKRFHGKLIKGGDFVGTKLIEYNQIKRLSKTHYHGLNTARKKQQENSNPKCNWVRENRAGHKDNTASSRQK